MKTILVTGGAGYIGSIAATQLIEEGYAVVIVDNFSNSSIASVRQVEKLTGKSVPFYEVDLRHEAALSAVFSAHAIDAVIHFAALKAVGESVEQPVRYYQNNVGGSLTLCEVMAKNNVKNIVFSSSATVYGDPDQVPITEEFPLKPTNPYGYTKWMIEQILMDVHAADSTWNVAILRYFNPVGAHKSGELGESPRGVPNNLSPYVAQVAVGRREYLQVFGDDYDTPDGTGVRDYLHVLDLVDGHLKALEKLMTDPGVVIYNLGRGTGDSVLDMVHSFEKASQREIPYQVVGRRAGDIATCFADPSKANAELDWKAERDLDEMVADVWHWQSKYPNGFDD